MSPASHSDSATRDAVARADILLLGIGGADLNRGDDRWQSGACTGKACYAGDLKTFGTQVRPLGNIWPPMPYTSR